jgi:hypothetical protein
MAQKIKQGKIGEKQGETVYLVDAVEKKTREKRINNLQFSLRKREKTV